MRLQQQTILTLVMLQQLQEQPLLVVLSNIVNLPEQQLLVQQMELELA